MTLFALGCVCTTSCREIIEKMNTRKNFFFLEEKSSELRNWFENWCKIQFSGTHSHLSTILQRWPQSVQDFTKIYNIYNIPNSKSTHKQASKRAHYFKTNFDLDFDFLEPFFAYRYGPNLTKTYL